MLRSNRKTSPLNGQGGASSTNNATASSLPSFYTNGSSNSSGSLQELSSNSSLNNTVASPIASTPSIPFPTLQKRRKRRFLLGGAGGSTDGPGSTNGSRRSWARRWRRTALGRPSPILSCLLGTLLLIGTSMGTYHYIFGVTSSRHRKNRFGVYADPANTMNTNHDNKNYVRIDGDWQSNDKERQLLQNARRHEAAAQQEDYRPINNSIGQHYPQGSVAAMLPPKPPTHGLYDVVVLGTGPAGLTAALFAARAGLSTLVLGSDGGSLLSETHLLQNFPSYDDRGAFHDDSIGGGSQWLEKTKQQAAQWGASFVQAGILVDSMTVQEHNDNAQEGSIRTTTFDLLTQVGGKSIHIYGRSVIVATGATGRRLGLPLESELWGKSVHSCAVCDGSSYVGKTVVVVGGGDAAIDGALLLARYARQVILVHRRSDLRASNQRNVELVQSTSNIRLELSYTVERFETTANGKQGQQMLTGVELKHVNTQGTQHVFCDGVFELIGSTPNTQWLLRQGDDTSNNTPQMDESGFLMLSENNHNLETRTATTLEGVFAAGEVTDKIYRQAITAASEGAQAAMDAERWLRMHPVPKSTIKMANDLSAIPLQTFWLGAPQLSDTTKPQEAQMDKKQVHHSEGGHGVKTQTDGSTHSSSDDCDLTQEACITKLVHQYPVVVFSKPWCPYCRKALEALSAEGLPDGHKSLHVVDLSSLGESMRRGQGTLNDMTGRRTVPNVFVGGVSIGGGDETNRFHRDGTLRAKLRDAKAFDEKGALHDPAESTEEDSCNDLTQETCITRLINRYAVVVFSKQGCPHCRRALEALAMEGVLQGENPHLHVVDLTTMADRTLVQDQLENMTGRRTVPNVFVGGSSIGGGSETVQLHHTGDLRTMLDKVEAIEKEKIMARSVE